MNKLIKLLLMVTIIGVVGCDDSSVDDNTYTVTVTLQDDVTVAPGTEITLVAEASVSPSIEDVKFKYHWRKVVYYKPFDEIVDDHGGDEESAFDSLEKEIGFSTRSSITDVMPSLQAGGYVEYYVKADAYGFTFNNTDSDAPKIIRTDFDTTKVFVVD